MIQKRDVRMIALSVAHQTLCTDVLNLKPDFNLAEFHTESHRDYPNLVVKESI